MTEPTPLRLVKTGAPEVDAEVVEAAVKAAEAMVEAVKVGEGFWLLVGGDEPVATFGGDMLEMSALAEEVARSMKMEYLGMGGA